MKTKFQGITEATIDEWLFVSFHMEDLKEIAKEGLFNPDAGAEEYLLMYQQDSDSVDQWKEYVINPIGTKRKTKAADAKKNKLVKALTKLAKDDGFYFDADSEEEITVLSTHYYIKGYCAVLVDEYTNDTRNRDWEEE